ncbi:Hypothetical predicted protein [Mytilus galloprovincialis]|uniref:ZP domain-containing protein n=1 Tax=Mytilus galloprovincialis TaxID=29158 RepID=A0A8B6HNY8_MYTGA|nr:Hypothetical predicted protein [Mytilus galloprovincialis]
MERENKKSQSIFVFGVAIIQTTNANVTTTAEPTAEETTPEQTAETTQPDPPPFHQGPQYTINCLESGNVEVKGVSESTSLTIVDGEKTCVNNSRTFNETHGKIVINSSCLSSDNFTDIRSVTFTIHDSTFDGKSSLTPHPVDGIKGGQNLHRITVNCKPLPKSGMNVYVVHGVGLATPEPNIPTEIKKVEMRLKSEKYDSFKDVTQLPDVSTVYIGDKFYMYLVYLGKDQYRVIPTDCKAFEGAYASEPSSSVKKLDLYNTSCLTQNAIDYRVMQPFHFLKVNETRIVSAEMYGFMFNLDNEITFANCDVDWQSKRRRRSAIQDKQYTITKRLRVQGQTVQNSSVKKNGKMYTSLIDNTRTSGFSKLLDQQVIINR